LDLRLADAREADHEFAPLTHSGARCLNSATMQIDNFLHKR